MEARASDAEKKVQELNAKLERVSIRLAIIVLLTSISLCGYQLLEKAPFAQHFEILLWVGDIVTD